MLKVIIIDESEAKVLLDEECESIMGATHNGKDGGKSLAIIHGTSGHVASMASRILALVKMTLKENPKAAALLLAEDLFRYFTEDKKDA